MAGYGGANRLGHFGDDGKERQRGLDSLRTTGGRAGFHRNELWEGNKDKRPFLIENFNMTMVESQIVAVRIRLCGEAL